MIKKLLLLLILLSSSNIVVQACDETIIIDSVTYQIDSIWCGKKIDTSLIAKFEDLSRIPDSLCYKESKIYIRTDARDAFVKMALEAQKDSVFFTAKSGFRSPSYQKQMIRRRLKENKKFADIIRFAAPPGYSTHSIGNALDIATNTHPFEKSKAYAWLIKHAYKYGFIETYPKGNLTLKTWEPWHWEFVGKKSALLIHKK